MDVTNAGRVLVVDDDKHAVEILYRLLQKEGFEVLRAQSGKEALATVAAENVDVILLDVMMPEMDGFAVCEALRAAERTREIPTILLTADGRLPGRRRVVALLLTLLHVVQRHTLQLRDVLRRHAAVEILVDDAAIDVGGARGGSGKHQQARANDAQ